VVVEKRKRIENIFDIAITADSRVEEKKRKIFKDIKILEGK
jgi:hypothetical protein